MGNEKKKPPECKYLTWWEFLGILSYLIVHKTPSWMHPQTKSYWLVSKICGCLFLSQILQPHQIQTSFQAGKV